jgi:Holliday junction resolvase RusA-like endonuclease
MKLELTIPPTTNNLFATVGKKRIASEEYKSWQEVNGWPLKNKMSREYRFEYPVRIIITIRGGKGFPESRDASNCIKAVEDLLVKCGVITGDTVKHVREVRALYLPPEGDEKATCTVELFPVGVPIDSFTIRGERR